MSGGINTACTEQLFGAYQRLVALQIAFPLESDIKCMDPAASAEACKAAESATNIALVHSCSSIAAVHPDMHPCGVFAWVTLLLTNPTASARAGA